MHNVSNMHGVLHVCGAYACVLYDYGVLHVYGVLFFYGVSQRLSDNIQF